MPIGIGIALARFPGRSLIVSLINTGMGLPPVVVGLFVTIFLLAERCAGIHGIALHPSRHGYRAGRDRAPDRRGLTMAAFQSLNPSLSLQLLGIGASKLQLVWLLCKEARLPLLAAVMAGFGGVISEVGASMMVVGTSAADSRIDHRNSSGKQEVNFEVAIALGLIFSLLPLQ